MERERHSQFDIDVLKQRRRAAAERVRRVLQELEDAERDFDRATLALRKALEEDSSAA